MAKYKKRKDGRYETKVLIGYDENTGKRIRKEIYANTINELDLKRSKIMNSIDNKTYVAPSNITFKVYKERWLNNKVISLEMNTIRMYKIVLKNYLYTIDDKELKDIVKSDIQEIINKNKDKIRTCEQIKLTLNQIFESAIDDALVFKNPCRKIVLPKKQKSAKRALTQQEDILSNITEFSDREQAFIKIIKYSGLRKEEALALTKDHINFDKNIIMVRQALVFDGNKPIIKEPKTKAGIRDIPMPHQLASFLKYYVSNLETDYLFYNLINKEQITAQSYKKMWASIINKMNKKALDKKMDYVIKGLSAHIFRHNYATMLYYADIKIKEAQKILGHANINITMDIYTHLEENNELTTTKLNKFLNSKEISVK